VTLGPGDVLGVDFGFNFSTVTNVRDAGQGSLRQVLTNANAMSNAGLAQAGRTAGIENAIFMIGNGTSAPGLRTGLNFFASGAATIPLVMALPSITDPIVIDATAQPGYSVTPVVELNGAGTPAATNGLNISAGASTVRGLAINRFSGSAISIISAGGNQIIGNFLGTNSGGTAPLANGSHGVLVTSSPNNTIGGTSSSTLNVISGNAGDGVRITGAGATSNDVQGNFIGLDVSGAVALGNTGSGVRVETSNNHIGGMGAGAANQIAGNHTGGVVIPAGVTNVLILHNVIFGNTGLGIDLGADGVTANNGATGGANNGIDYPVFTSATLNGSILAVNGYVGSAPSQTTFAGATVDIFKADKLPRRSNGEIVVGDGRSAPHGEGRVYLGTLTADANGYFTGTISSAA